MNVRKGREKEGFSMVDGRRGRRRGGKGEEPGEQKEGVSFALSKARRQCS